MVKLSKEEVVEFSKANDDDWFFYRYNDMHYVSIYKEHIADKVFYRILSHDKFIPDFNKPEVVFFINFALYENGQYRFLGFTKDLFLQYNRDDNDDSEQRRVPLSVDIVQGKKGSYNIMYSEIHVPLSDDNIYNTDVKYGRTITRVEGLNSHENPIDIEIEGFCLIDHTAPMKYAIQNAIDNNPNTSFVAKNDGTYGSGYFTFWFMGNSSNLNVNTISYINGYAQSENLYYANNRIKKIKLEIGKRNYFISSYKKEKEFYLELEDNSLSPQIFNLQDKIQINSGKHFGFSIIEIYKGNRYDDTCLAEININTDEYGWLF